MNIKDYVYSKRFIKCEPMHSEFYQLLYDDLLPDELDTVKPELFICCSIDRTIEQVKFCKKDYLIFDESLGETLRELNYLYFDSENKNDTEYYIYQLLAEMLYANGEPIISQNCFLSSLFMSGKVSFKRPLEDDNNTLCFLIQVMFVFFHEIRHWELNSLNTEEDKRNKINSARKNIIHYLEYEKEALEKYDDQIYDPVIEDLCKETGIDISKNEFDDIKKILKSSFHKDDVIEKELNLILNNDDAVEECFCDTLATLMVLNMCEKTFNLEKTEAIKMIYLAIEHLSSLKILQTSIQLDKDLTYCIYETVIRSSFFRFCAGSVFCGDNQMLAKELTKINEKYVKKIKDYITFTVPSNLEDLRQEKLNKTHFQEKGFEQAIKMLGIVDFPI